MAETKKEISEQQLVQMAQQEEALLNSKKNYYSKIKKLIKENATTLDAIKELKKNPEKLMVNIGSGVLVDVKIENFKEVQRAFSNNGYKKEKIDDSIKTIKERKKNLEEQLQKIGEDLQKTETQLNNIINILKQIDVEKRKQISLSK